MSNQSIEALMEKVRAVGKKDQRAYVHGLKSIRDTFLGAGAGMKTAKVREEAQSIRGKAVEASGILDALVGISYHDEANDRIEGFLARIALECFNNKTDPMTITREDIVRRFAEFEKGAIAGRSSLKLEQSAIDSYKASAELPIEDKYFSVTNVTMSEIDLYYRRALRIPDAAQRNGALNGLQLRLLEAAKNAPSKGIQAEMLTIWWLRKLVREQGIDHLVSIEHATISTDLKGGPDIVIRAVGVGSFGIQLKTLNRDGYTDKFQDELIEKAMKLKKSDTVVSEFSSLDLQDMIQKEREGVPNARLRNKLLAVLASDFEEDKFTKAVKLVQRLGEAPKVSVDQTISLPPATDVPSPVRRRAVRP